MKKALIIFVRKPEKGKVKTRLAASVGDDAALFIYQKLLQHTQHITEAVEADKLVFYAGDVAAEDLWQREGYVKKKQSTGDLGRRMNDAFEEAFKMGYKKVCIIGSDCFELTPEIILNAFNAWDKSDIVIGPACDGGYYLLGMTQLYPELFQNRAWSTASVLNETMQTTQDLNLTVERLPALNDVDEVDNVPKEWLHLLKP